MEVEGTLRNVVLAILIPVLVCAGLACRDARHAEEAKPVVAVSVLPQAFIVEQVAGDRVEVEVMIPPGASPATHEPTMQQMDAVSRAALYVKVGHPNFPFERAWLDTILADHDNLPVVDGSAGVRRREGDPHVWVSPGCVRVMADNVAAALSEALPAHGEEFRRNLALFQGKIDALDAEIRRSLEKHRGRKFYVFHPAWGYFAAEYGLEQVAVQEGTGEATPGALAGLIDRARSDSVRIIFVQPQFSRESAELVAREIDGSVLAIDPLARDWLDNLARTAVSLREAFER
jgi:zinc transport system substrate-binding protein